MMLQLPDVIEQQEVVWSFGLRWYALLEANERAQAHRIVKEIGAQSWVLTGTQIGSVGLCDQRIRRKGQPVYLAAAAYFAHVYARQKAAAIIHLPSGEFWFVAAQQGRVLVRGDHCFTDLKQAQAFMAAVLTDNPKLRCLHPHSGCMSWLDLLALRPQTNWIHQVSLQPRRRINLRWCLGVLLIGIALVVYYLWVGWAATRTVSAADLEADSTPDPVQPVLDLHPQAVLQPVLEFLYELPIRAMGWSLQQTQCQLAPEQLTWRCTAQYQQGADAIDVEGFLTAQQWQTQAQMVNLSTFRIDFPAVQVKTQRWNNPQSVTLLQFLGYLHKQQTVFSDFTYQHREQSLAAWQGRTRIQIQGPLRSVHLLYEAPVHIQWHQVTLHVQPQVQLGLKSSRLNVVLEGAVDDEQLN